MEFLSVDAVSFNQLIVTVALGLFATMIFLSIFIRIQRQYRVRNTLPNHTPKKRVFGRVRTRDPNFVNIPTENHEVVTGARPKTPVKDEFEGFHFDFDVPEKPTGPIEHVAAQETGDAAPFDRPEVLADSFVGDIGALNSNGANRHDYEEAFAEENIDVPEEFDQSIDEETANGDNENTDNLDSDREHVETWEANDSDEFLSNDLEETLVAEGLTEDAVTSEFVEEEYPDDEYEFEGEIAESSAYEDELPATEYSAADDLPTTVYEDQNVEQPLETEVDDGVVPFDRRAVEAKRVGTLPEETNRSLSVVSVCLISDDDGQIYRDIRGEYLDAFLNNRGFIYLDEEYHLKHKSTVDRGAIRVRNYEAMSIGNLVKEDQETCGFRLYFRPRDCADALGTLNEMLKIANLAKGFFSDVCAKPLRIYDGRKDSTGNISPFTQEDYNALKRDINAAFPRNPEAASKRTTVIRNEYAPSDDLPTRAEQY